MGAVCCLGKSPDCWKKDPYEDGAFVCEPCRNWLVDLERGSENLQKLNGELILDNLRINDEWFKISRGFEMRVKELEQAMYEEKCSVAHESKRQRLFIKDGDGEFDYLLGSFYCLECRSIFNEDDVEWSKLSEEEIKEIFGEAPPLDPDECI